MSRSAPHTTRSGDTNGVPAVVSGQDAEEGHRRAVIYLRVSTTAQAKTDLDDEGFSIPAQRDACTTQAHTLGAVVEAEFLDRGESAKSADRPALKRMLLRVAEGDIDFVIVHKVDRLARSREDDVAINMAIRQAGARLVSVTENVDETPSGKLLHGIMATMAEFYSANLANEAIKGMTSKAKKGGTPGAVPIGYLNVREMFDGREIRTVIVDLERAPLVLWAFQAYSTGDWTLRQLTAELERRGFRSVATARKPSGRVHLAQVAKMLTRPYYIGIVTFRGIEYEGRHEPVVDRATFEKVQRVLESKRNTQELQRIHNHYLKGSVFCGHCGSRMIFSRNTGTGGTYDYFVCAGRHGKRGPCALPYLSVDQVEEQVVDLYARIQLSPERVQRLRAVLREALQEAIGEAEGEIARQTRQLTRLKAERKKLLQAHYAGAVDLDLLTEEQGRIRREESTALELLSLAEEDLPSDERLISRAIDLAANCREAYRLASGKLRRQFNQSFFTRIEITEEGVVGTELTDGFATLLNQRAVERLLQPTALREVSPESKAEPSMPDAEFEALMQRLWGDSPPNETNSAERQLGQSSKCAVLVELRRLELLTPCLPGKCSSQLSYSPMNTRFYRKTTTMYRLCCTYLTLTARS